MTEVTSIVLNDGQATPVAHTFAPDGMKDNVLAFADRSSGIPVGFAVLTIGRRQTNGGNGTFRVSLKLKLPTLEQTSASTSTGIQPAPTVAYVTEVNMDFVLPARSTQANRADILAYAKNLLANTAIESAIEDLDLVYV